MFDSVENYEQANDDYWQFILENWPQLPPQELENHLGKLEDFWYALSSEGVNAVEGDGFEEGKPLATEYRHLSVSLMWGQHKKDSYLYVARATLLRMKQIWDEVPPAWHRYLTGPRSEEWPWAPILARLNEKLNAFFFSKDSKHAHDN